MPRNRIVELGICFVRSIRDVCNSTDRIVFMIRRDTVSRDSASDFP